MYKSPGTNPSECYLANLCQRTFLDLWSYPNVFRDERRGDKIIAQEICDLLVVCGNDVIIFSDKSSRLISTGDRELNWRRWYTKAITKSVKQLYGAERWIRANPNRVFLDNQCAQRLSLLPKDSAKLQIHRIAVAVGARDACQTFYGGGGSGSLIIEGGTNTNDDSIPQLPYCVKQADFGGGFVHVFDEVTLDLVLGELSTITDLLEYLTKKEALFQSKSFVISTGEEELLAYYFRNYKEDQGGYGFNVPQNVNGLFIQEGFWDGLRTHPQYIARKSANKISYIWDGIINKLTLHALNGTLTDGSSRELANYERILRMMAIETRASRRSLVRAFVGILEAPLKEAPLSFSVNTRSVRSFRDAKTAYVFQSHQTRAPGENEAEYRKRRVSFLHAYCMAFALRHEELIQVIGIATEFGVNRPTRSHDVVFVDASDRTPEFVHEASRLQEIFGVCKDENLSMERYHDNDFPKVPSLEMDETIQPSGKRAKYKSRRKRSR